MLSVFLIHIASLMCLPALSDSRSMTFPLSQSITWFSLQTWSVIAGLLQILAALVFSALVKIPVMLSTSLRYSFTLQHRCIHSFYMVLVNHFWLFFITDSVFSVHCTSIFLNVVCGLTTVQILYVFNIRLNASLNPFTYDIVSMPRILLTDDQYQKSVLMKASDAKPKHR